MEQYDTEMKMPICLKAALAIVAAPTLIYVGYRLGIFLTGG